MSGRIRSIKPEWLDDERLGEASSEARVLSIALLLLADDYGNGRAGLNQLAGRVFPGKVRETVEKALNELATLSFVLLYEVDGQHYFHVRNWEKHQKVDKPGKPKVPAPSEQFEKVPESLANVRASRVSPPLPIPLPDPKGGAGGPPAHVRNFEASFGQPHPDDEQAFARWAARFAKTGARFDAKRAQCLEDRRLEGMTLDDVDAALEGAAVDEWLRGNGFKLSLIFANRERFEECRDRGREIRAGTYRAPTKSGPQSAHKQPSVGYRSERTKHL